MTKTTDAVSRSVLVPLSREAAFDLFTARFGDWWPKDSHHLSKAPVADAFLEPRVGGRWYERAEDGSECDWGHVRELDPPARILLAWHLTPDWEYDPDPAKATEVEVLFSAEDHGTRVTLEHRGFEVHGEPGTAMRDSVGGEGGWRSLLELYRQAAQSGKLAGP
jgi:uncharacterized protein YndB with AHSA1/START domain